MAETADVSPDEIPDNADWLRQSWGALPTTEAALRGLLKLSGMTIDEFKRTRVYRMNVGKLGWLKHLGDE